jgi:O-glycosyl hydrolase
MFKESKTMRKATKLFFGLFFILAFGIAWTTCDLGTAKRENTEEAKDPFIKYQPLNTTIAKSATAIRVVPLSVTAENIDGGTLTYQWYSNTTNSNQNGTKIEGATKSTFFPPFTLETEPGEYYFYVVITNTLQSGDKAEYTSAPAVYKIVAEPASPDNTITVDIATKYQYVRGFGGSMIIWDNFPDDRVEDYEKMCNPITGLGLNLLRIMIPPDNENIDEMMQALIANETRFSGTWWYDDHKVAPPTHPNGWVGKDESDYYDIVKKVNEHGGYVFGSPWTPPAVWKANGIIEGGTNDYLLPDCYDEYANWLSRFAEIMYENGAPLYSVSLQNEFSYETSGYEGCRYTALQHQNFYRQQGNFFKNNGVPGFGGGQEIPWVQSMSGESHNSVSYLNSLVENTTAANEARQGIDLLARHIYGVTENTSQTFLSYAQFHPTDPKEVWQTEWSTGEGGAELVLTWNRVWEFINAIDYTIRHCNESGFVWFPSKSFHAIMGDGGDGTVNGEVLPRGYAMSQYAKYANETGRVGVSAEGSNSNRVNPANFSGVGNTTTANFLGAKISAFVTLNDDFYAGPVATRHRRWRGLDNSGLETIDVSKIRAISLVMFTPTTNTGANGVDMGTVKIQLPSGFVVGRTTAMRSIDQAYAIADSENVIIGADGNSAFVTLPAGNVLSVRFEKE